MTISLKHAFTSAKVDGGDTTLIRPSNWNAEHTLTMATGKLLGRLTAGTGSAEEITVTTYMASLFATADFAALAAALGLPTTGDGKLTFKTTADTGWVLMNDGSIGNASSSATNRANADCQDLFYLFYDNLNDTNAPIQTSAGAATTRAAQGTKATAWGNNCRLVLPRQLGRAIILAGAGSGLTSRALGAYGGAETHTLVASETPSHTHSVTSTGTGTGSGTGSGSGSFSGTTGAQSANHTHTQNGTFTTGTESASHTHTEYVPSGTIGVQGGGTYPAINYTSTTAQTGSESVSHSHSVTISGQTGLESDAHTHSFSGSVTSSVSVSVSTTVSVSGTTSSVGSDGAHNNMQPYTAWNVMVKL